MAIVARNEIRGYWVREENQNWPEMVCIKCVSDNEAVKAKISDIIDLDEMESDDQRSYYCDRCERLLAEHLFLYYLNGDEDQPPLPHLRPL